MQGYFAFDLASFIFAEPSRWVIQALTATEVYVITQAQYAKLADRVPRWSEIEKQLLMKCFVMLEDRIFSHLAYSAEDRYQMFFDKYKNAFQPAAASLYRFHFGYDTGNPQPHPKKNATTNFLTFVK